MTTKVVTLTAATDENFTVASEIMAS